MIKSTKLDSQPPATAVIRHRVGPEAMKSNVAKGKETTAKIAALKPLARLEKINC
jgi:hypothetical protein